MRRGRLRAVQSDSSVPRAAGRRIAGLLARRPTRAATVWVASVTAALLVGAAIGPITANAQSAPATGGSAAARPGPSGPRPAFPRLRHIFVIMMENTSYSDLLSPNNPDTGYIRHLAATAGLETDYFGVTHTSLPNYIAATSGQTWGSNNDDDAQAPYFDHENIVDEFQAAHVSWAAYMQSLPYPGDTADTASNGLYVRKHDPFLMYPDVYNDPTRARHVVPLSRLRTDLADGHVPQFAWITPNVCDDMHGGAAPCPYATPSHPSYQATLYADGNDFLRTWVGLITSSRLWRQGPSAIFITWDEGSYNDVSPYQPLDDRGGPDSPILPKTPADPATGSGGDLAGGTVYGGGHVPLIVVTNYLHGHRTDATPADHYSLLRTIEENFGLPLLGDAGDGVQVRSLAPLLTPAG